MSESFRTYVVAAMDENNCIGNKNTIPWRLPGDLQRFKQLTLNSSVIMGRNTHESIGRLLPKRHNIIVSRRDPPEDTKGAIWVNTPQKALEEAASLSEKRFVIGGSQIYGELLDVADVLYLTKVKTKVPEGDAYFPEINKQKWQKIVGIPGKADNDEFEHEFQVWISR